MIDLGTAPASNAYLTPEALHRAERHYPLRVLVCESCWLVQTEDYVGREELFTEDYAYFSSMSSSWLAHAQRYVDQMIRRLRLGPGSMVVEVAANDGYLLQYVRKAGVPCLGIEPAASTAAHARRQGIETIEAFFGIALADALAAQGRSADLIVANNVLAHVPDIDDFVAGFARLLKPEGVATFEFPHLLNLVRECHFDTIYHEHYSYLSLRTVQEIFAACGLSVFDAEELPTHGGSLRVYAQRSGGPREIQRTVAEIIECETRFGLFQAGTYRALQSRAEQIKNRLLRFLIDTKERGRRVVAYGAAAKGNTLLNFAGVRGDLLEFVADRSPGKRGRYLPGSRIPIVDERRLLEEQPDYVLLLPWNLRDELLEQLSAVRRWKGEFVTAVPTLEIIA